MNLGLRVHIHYISLVFFSLFLFVLIYPLSAESAWFDNNFTYCRKMTMTAGGDSGGVATTTTIGFPLVATTTISALAATSSGGKIQKLDSTGEYPLDLIFTSGTDCNTNSGSLLDFYIEDWATSTGAMVAWVEATDISSTSAKTVLMYYGNSTASDQRDKAGTWETNGIKAKWDLDENPAGVAPQMLDATVNDNDGTSNGSMTSTDQVAGQIDGSLDLDGSDDYIQTPSTSLKTDNNFTMSIWFKTRSTAFASFLLWQGQATENGWSGTGCTTSEGHLTMGNINTGGASEANKLAYFLGDCQGSAGTIRLETPFTDTTKWNHAVVTVSSLDSSPSGVLYLNGTSVSTDTGDLADTPRSSWDTNLRIGRPGTAVRFFNGLLDDVRIYGNALHAMDVKTVYNNTSRNDVFWTFGTEETQTAAAAASTARHQFFGGIYRIIGGALRLQ